MVSGCFRLALPLVCAIVPLLGQPAPESLEPLFREALALREEAFGPKHPRVAASLVDLAEFLRRNGDAAAAEPLLLRARSIYENTDRGALGRVLASLSEIAGNDARAMQLLRDSITAHETFGTVTRLADLREKAGDLSEAESLYRRSLEIASEPLDIASACNNLGLAIEAQGRFSEAERLFARAASIYEKTLGRNHPEFAATLVNLAGALAARDDVQTAVGLLRNAWNVLEETLGRDHPHTRAACQGLIAALQQASRAAEAADAQRRCR